MIGHRSCDSKLNTGARFTASAIFRSVQARCMRQSVVDDQEKTGTKVRLFELTFPKK
jgi:hypothetical protein